MFGNLLTDPLIRVTYAGSETRLATLPEVLANLSEGDSIHTFPGLAPHQVQAWHCFLVQVAALALLETSAPSPSPPMDVGSWTSILRSLTSTYPEDEPWTLAVPDSSKPAFLQPPVLLDDLCSFAGPTAIPDELDILVTTRNHDLKVSRAFFPEVDQWVFVLVSLQTLSGFSGRGNYGIVRMNAGFASRPLVTMAPGRGWGERFRRDLSALLLLREDLLRAHTFSCKYRLLWLLPWDGATSLPVTDLDPYAVEISRRIRLLRNEAGIVAFRKPTSGPRVAGEDLKGNVGDPWVPVRRSDGAALNISESGFHYRLVHQLLFGEDYAPAPCQRVLPSDPEELHLWCIALARGQGGTAGLHERWIPIPRRVRRHLLFAETRDSLATVSRARIEDAGTVSKTILRPALLSLAQGAPDELDFRDKRVGPLLDRFDRLVDQTFFERLWAEWELPDPERRVAWAQHLRAMARQILRRAENALPVPLARRYRATARAWSILEGGFRKHFPELEPPRSQEVIS